MRTMTVIPEQTKIPESREQPCRALAMTGGFAPDEQSLLEGDRVLRSLVAHGLAFTRATTVVEAQDEMQRIHASYAAVVNEQQVVGLLSKARIDQHLGSRSGIGFALFARRPVQELVQEQFLQVMLGQPMTEVLAATIARTTDAFHDDVVLIEPDGALIGLIPVHKLVYLQHKMLLVKIEQLGAAGEQFGRINRDLVAARDKALSATRAKSSFLANMSHEIRTPLNGVIGMISLLQQTQLDEEQRECLTTIQRSGQSLLTVLNDVLDFSKIESGHLDLEIQPVNIEGCLLNCLHLFSGKAAEKNLELAYCFEAGVPAVIACDPMRLQQIFCNLIGNAVKFTERGEVFVRVALEQVECSDGRSSLRFEVHDSGVGIPADKVKKLFQPFSQIDASSARRHGGTGLGLAICRRLIELLEGEIGVESQPGHGATFWFRLPVNLSGAEAWPRQMPRASLAGRNLLVADDNTTCRRILRELVEPWGMHVTEVASPDELLALEDVLHQFDYLVIDASFASSDPLLTACRSALSVGRNNQKLAWIDCFGKPALQKRAALDFAFSCLSKPVEPTALLGFFEGPVGRETCSPSTTEPVSDDSSLTQLRLLVAEDNLVNQKVIRQMLKKIGCQADIVVNGAQAGAAVQRGDYDVVFMDIQMPEMDGYEATRFIRRTMPAKRQPWIVALTANAMTGDEEKCLEVGMDAYLSKPLVFSRLVEVLKKAQAVRRQSGAAQSCPGLVA